MFASAFDRRVAVITLGIATSLCAQPTTPPALAPAPLTSVSSPLSLGQFMQRVVEYNESVQARLLAFHAARSQRRAEGGLFEPTWVTTGEYVDNKKANTVEAERNLRTGGIFRERNQNYSSALEVVAPLGTRVRFGATGSQLINNIQRTVFVTLDAEYQTSVGLTVEQPLLKGFGRASTLAALRLAARGSDLAFQDYRRGLMQTIAEAEAAYWQLYFAQQEVRLSGESVTLAETLLRDSRANFDAGRGSRLDVLEAEAGLALRRSRESVSKQRRVEAANRLAAFAGGGTIGGELVAAEQPPLRKVDVAIDEGSRTAFAMSPDLLKAEAQVGQERVRLGYAKNQRLPQLDLKTTYAQTGLGPEWTASWKDISRDNFPAWTIGLEMRIPLFGGIRGRNEYRAAQQHLLQAERAAADVASQVRTGLDSAEQRVSATYTAAQSLQSVVEFRSNLLQTRLQGRDVGRLDARSVLEAEQELFAARLDQLQSAIEYERALLELQLISGSLLQSRGLEIDFEELERRTGEWMKTGKSAVPVHYQPATFIRWPVAPPVPFVGDVDPSYPLRVRFHRAGK